jgi:1,4-alpha-glucan branching enzyme
VREAESVRTKPTPAPAEAAGSERVGDLAVVLHSHMPYVEGFGTYPFGEEWLFDAVLRSHLPVLEIAHGVTVTVTPVLADQLEAEGVAERLRAFVGEYRIGSCEADARDFDEPALRDACLAEGERYRRALGRLEALGDDLLAIFREPAREGRVELATSAATHAVLPLIATAAGRRLQLETGLRSHRRRFGAPAGLWLPECAYEEGLDSLLAELGIAWFATDQSSREPPLDALVPIVSAGGPVALTIDWEAVSWLWSAAGYPSAPSYADFHRKSLRGARPWSIGGEPYDAESAARLARRQAAEFVSAVAARLELFRAERGRPGLVCFAIDTELLGHWWWEGAAWLAEVQRLAPERGVGLVTAAEALATHAPEPRSLGRTSWGEGKDLRTWDSPEVADLAWAARRLELRLLRALGEGLAAPAAQRAARELLALQASDWAFLDRRKQAGDYAYQRASEHGARMLEAIHSAGRQDPRLRNLAPDLSLTPFR